MLGTVHRRSSPAKGIVALAGLSCLIAVVGLGSRPSAAQECTNCKIPSGYTTLKGDSGGSCVNKLVACTCTPPGGKPTKSSQEMCLYKVAVGGNLHAVETANPPGK